MYTPPHFTMKDETNSQKLMHTHNFATLVSGSSSNTVASHLPLMWTNKGGKHGTLHGHMARANPQWKHFEDKREVLAIFLGNHTYISPNWYASKPAVPTWNYSAVHAYGVPILVENLDKIKDLLRQMVEHHDPDPGQAWPNTTSHSTLVDEMLSHIVAFDIPISTLQSKAKLSQNRPDLDRDQVMDVLRSSQATGAQEVAHDMSVLYTTPSSMWQKDLDDKS